MIKDIYLWVLFWSESPYSPFALFTLAFAESFIFPVPPDVLLIAMGLSNPSQVFWFAAITTCGSVLGGAFGYMMGSIGGKMVLERFISKEKIDLVHRYFEKYEAWAICIAGLTPVPYKVFTISAGAFYINFRKFIFYSILSRGARFFMVAGLIRLFGAEIRNFIEGYFNLFTVLFLFLLIGGFYLVKALSKGKKIKGVGQPDD